MQYHEKFWGYAVSQQILGMQYRNKLWGYAVSWQILPVCSITTNFWGMQYHGKFWGYVVSWQILGVCSIMTNILQDYIGSLQYRENVCHFIFDSHLQLFTISCKQVFVTLHRPYVVLQKIVAILHTPKICHDTAYPKKCCRDTGFPLWTCL